MSANPRIHQETPICLLIRPLRDGESEVISQVFDQLSSESAFLRFHSGMPCLPPTFLRRLSAVIPGTCEAYVAELDGHPVGVARWHRYPDQPAVADLAVEVADSVHRRGIATLLLRAVIESAAARGVAMLSATVHPHNRVVRRWLSSVGAEPPVEHHGDYRLSTQRALLLARHPELSAITVR